jgi:hypothetical protein
MRALAWSHAKGGAAAGQTGTVWDQFRRWRIGNAVAPLRTIAQPIADPILAGVDLLATGAVDLPDIRVVADSTTVVALADGGLTVSQAYASGRLRVEASLADLLRLRAAL